MALTQSLKILDSVSHQIELSDTEALVNLVSTSLSSKVVANNREKLAPLAVKAVMQITDTKVDTNVDLRDICICKKKGGTIDDGADQQYRWRYCSGEPVRAPIFDG